MADMREEWVKAQVDRLKVDRLKEKTCTITLALQSSAYMAE
jgi:hypothetical protein